MTATPRTESAPPTSTTEDEWLGGSRSIAASAPRLPIGFVAEAVAAGFTAPCGVVVTGERVYVLETGHPRRTPPRLFRVEAKSGAASLLAAFERTADGQPFLTLADGLPTVVYAGVSWLVADDEMRISDEMRTGVPGAPATFLPGSWLAEDGAWYLVDPGPPDAGGAFVPGAGIVWRIRAGEPETPSRYPTRGWSPRLVRETVAARPRPVIALSVGVAVAAVGLALYYRTRRGRVRSGAATAR